MGGWSEASDQLDRDSFQALIAGDIPAVHIVDFATAVECASACQTIRDPALCRSAATTTAMDLIGSNFSNHGGAQHYTFRPRRGELILFNTRYPHRVVVDRVPVGQDRIQVGSFIGRTKDDRLVLWS